MTGMTDMPNIHINQRDERHRFELVVNGLFPDAVVHAYFISVQAVARCAANFGPATYWTIFDLTMEPPVPIDGIYDRIGTLEQEAPGHGGRPAT
jgi:hypothetical protein